MRLDLRSLIAIATTTAACTSMQAEKRTPDANPLVPKETIVNSDLDLTALGQSFQSADGAAFAAHYTKNAVMTLSNGVVLRGSAALKAAAEESGPSVLRWDVESPRSYDTPSARYLFGGSHTTLAIPDAPPLELRGERLIVHRGSPPEISVDISVPDNGTAVAEDWKQRYETMQSAWNTHDADDLGANFATDATSVLSDGSQSNGRDEIRAMFDFAFGAKLRDMEVSPYRAYVAGPDSIYVASRFSFSFTPDKTSVTLTGCQVDLWKQNNAAWTIAVRVAQPSASPACL